MDVDLPMSGAYVVAVSGGVDSMVLLDLLRQQPHLRLVVAHFDHGIREDSAQDRRHVQAVAKQHGINFVYHEGNLGADASEAQAREARYAFLHQVRQASAARAIVTAHHQDDLLETAIINMIRGSGRKGLTALDDRHEIRRPLLRVPKRDLIAYANDQGLVWHEDSTNADTKYLRNYVRHRILTRFDEAARNQFLQHITDLRALNQEIDTLLVKYLYEQSGEEGIDRRAFVHLPHAVAREVLASWLRSHGINGFDTKLLERLVVAAKVGQVGNIFPVLGGYHLVIHKDNLALRHVER